MGHGWLADSSDISTVIDRPGGVSQSQLKSPDGVFIHRFSALYPFNMWGSVVVSCTSPMNTTVREIPINHRIHRAMCTNGQVMKQPSWKCCLRPVYLRRDRPHRAKLQGVAPQKSGAWVKVGVFSGLADWFTEKVLPESSIYSMVKTPWFPV